jgi:hypothetical protein
MGQRGDSIEGTTTATALCCSLGTADRGSSAAAPTKRRALSRAHIVRAHEPSHLAPIARGAVLKGRIRHLLQRLDGVTALLTHVFVDRHVLRLADSVSMSSPGDQLDSCVHT